MNPFNRPSGLNIKEETELNAAFKDISFISLDSVDGRMLAGTMKSITGEQLFEELPLVGNEFDLAIIIAEKLKKKAEKRKKYKGGQIIGRAE